MFGTRVTFLKAFLFPGTFSWVPQDGYLSYFQDQDEAETYRSEADARFHHHPSSQRQLSLGCVEAVRTEVRFGVQRLWFVVVLSLASVQKFEKLYGRDRNGGAVIW